MDHPHKPCKSPFQVEGITLKCSKCKAELPLLHPHIIVERSDEEGNLLCESCWREMEERKQRRS